MTKRKIEHLLAEVHESHTLATLIQVGAISANWDLVEAFQKEWRRKQIEKNASQLGLLKQIGLIAFVNFKDLCLLCATCSSANSLFRLNHSNGFCNIYLKDTLQCSTRLVRIGSRLKYHLGEYHIAFIKRDNDWVMVDTHNKPMYEAGVRPEEILRVFTWAEMIQPGCTWTKMIQHQKDSESLQTRSQ